MQRFNELLNIMQRGNTYILFQLCKKYDTLVRNVVQNFEIFVISFWVK